MPTTPLRTTPAPPPLEGVPPPLTAGGRALIPLETVNLLPQRGLGLGGAVPLF